MMFHDWLEKERMIQRRSTISKERDKQIDAGLSVDITYHGYIFTIGPCCTYRGRFGSYEYSLH